MLWTYNANIMEVRTVRRLKSHRYREMVAMIKFAKNCIPFFLVCVVLSSKIYSPLLRM